MNTNQMIDLIKAVYDKSGRDLDGPENEDITPDDLDNVYEDIQKDMETNFLSKNKKEKIQ